MIKYEEILEELQKRTGNSEKQVLYGITANQTQGIKLETVPRVCIEKFYVKDQTKASYVTLGGIKVNKDSLKYKKDGNYHQVYKNVEELARHVWLLANKYEIARKLEACNDYNTVNYINNVLDLKGDIHG